MKQRRYRVESPEQLEELGPLIKEGSIDSILRTWRFYRGTGRGEIWDGAIFIRFTGDRHRDAAVTKEIRGSVDRCAGLHYNLALHWCQDHLKEA